MTDTTAPDAITQALHVRFSDDGQHIRKWDRKSFDGSSEYRLAAHGAGEGLREAWRPIATWEGQPTGPENSVILCVDEGEGHYPTIAEAYYDPDAYGGTWWWANTASTEYYDSPLIETQHGAPTHWMPMPDAPGALTPPTDAGSTTREGGEGVTAEVGFDPVYSSIVPQFGDPNSDIPTAHKIMIHGYIRMEAAEGDPHRLYDRAKTIIAAWKSSLATTSSPDASPDSGEFQRGACLVRESAAKAVEGLRRETPYDHHSYPCTATMARGAAAIRALPIPASAPSNGGEAVWRGMMSLPIGDQRDRVWQVRGAAGEEALAYFDGNDWRVAPIRPDAEPLSFEPVAHADLAESVK